MVDEKGTSTEANDERKPLTDLERRPEHVGEADASSKIKADTDAGRAEEERRRESDQSDVRAAEQLAEDRVEPKPMTANEAKVLRTVANKDVPASSHFAQKFGNDPANPKPVEGMETHEEGEDGKLVEREDVDGVLLSRKTPDHPDLVYTTCHEAMVGDFLRAGWNRHIG